jgi:hypothetical protein
VRPLRDIIRHVRPREGRSHGHIFTLSPIRRVFFILEYDKEGDVIFTYDNRRTGGLLVQVLGFGTGQWGSARGSD